MSAYSPNLSRAIIGITPPTAFVSYSLVMNTVLVPSGAIHDHYNSQSVMSDILMMSIGLLYKGVAADASNFLAHFITISP